MPEVLRPRQEFPTPLFRLVLPVLLALIALALGLAAWIFVHQ